MVERTISQLVVYCIGDGLEVEEYLSRPVDDRFPGVVVGQEWRGIDVHFREMRRDLAGQGYVVLVPDLYDGEIIDEADWATALKARLDPAVASTKIAAGANYLRSLPYVADDVGVLGFCMGGSVTLLTLAESEDFQGGVVYYPSIYPEFDDIRRINCHIMFHHRIEDTATPKLEMDRLRSILEVESVPITYHKYEGADHAFTNDEYEPPYNEAAAADARERTVEFLASHLDSQPTETSVVLPSGPKVAQRTASCHGLSPLGTTPAPG